VIDKSDGAVVGFIGLGNIGQPMARAVVAGGYRVIVYDTDPARGEPFRDNGVTVAASLTDFSRAAVVLLAVPDDEAVTSVVSGLLSAPLAPNSTIVIHSTVLPATARQLSQGAADKGVAVIDAPASGGADRAAHGQLTLMAGGEQSAIDRVRPILATFANHIFHVGHAGSGSAAKLANQVMMFATLAGAHEAMDLVGHYGVEPEQILPIVERSTGGSWIASNWGFFDRVADEYDRTCVPLAYRPWFKDLSDVLMAGREAGCPMPLTGLLAQLVPPRIEERHHRTDEPAGWAELEPSPGQRSH
jgi:3-hydroxyisobutyrate dehydrogenase-like beta-hydroxyacid dehydrogenase